MSPTARILNKEFVLKAIAESKLGFSFGTPERIDDKALAAVLPILRETTTKRQYVTYPETDQLIVTDSGNIDKMTIKNTSKDNVFIRSGTIFKGKTQSRTLTRSSVIFPGQEVQLEVRCVHQSHGISKGAQVEYGGVIPHSMETKLYDNGFRPKDQSAFWTSVKDYTTTCGSQRITNDNNLNHEYIKCSNLDGGGNLLLNNQDVTFADLNYFTTQIGSASGSSDIRAMHVSTSVPGNDNLLAAIDSFNLNLDDILSKIKLHDNQVGMALLDTKGCQTIELYDVSESWSSLHRDAVRRVGDKLGDQEPQPFEFKEGTAIENVKWVLSREYKMSTIYKHKANNGEPDLEITSLTHDKFFGEVVELDGRVVHLVIIRKQ